MNHSQPNCAFNHKTTHDLIPRLVYADPARLPFPCSTKVVLNSGRIWDFHQFPHTGQRSVPGSTDHGAQNCTAHVTGDKDVESETPML